MSSRTPTASPAVGVSVRKPTSTRRKTPTTASPTLLAVARLGWRRPAGAAWSPEWIETGRTSRAPASPKGRGDCRRPLHGPLPRRVPEPGDGPDSRAAESYNHGVKGLPRVPDHGRSPGRTSRRSSTNSWATAADEGLRGKSRLHVGFAGAHPGEGPDETARPGQGRLRAEVKPDRVDLFALGHPRGVRHRPGGDWREADRPVRRMMRNGGSFCVAGEAVSARMNYDRVRSFPPSRGRVRPLSRHIVPAAQEEGVIDRLGSPPKVIHIPQPSR